MDEHSKKFYRIPFLECSLFLVYGGKIYMEKQDSRVLIHWEGNSGDKLIEHQTSATGWYYQVDRSFSQPKGEPPRMIQRH